MAGIARTGKVENSDNDGTLSHKEMLNSYIHNYVSAEGHTDLARSLRSGLKCRDELLSKSPNGKNNVNGIDSDGKDGDKDGIEADKDNFLFDWWCLFWDFYQAARNRGDANTPVAQYFNQAQHRARSIQQPFAQQPGMIANRNQYNMMMNNQSINDHHKRAMANSMRGNFGGIRNMQQQMVPGQREAGDVDMNGQPTAQSPMGGDSAHSPKRQRTDSGPFSNGGQMNNVNRGPFMPGQLHGPGVANGNNMLISRGVPGAGLQHGSPMMAQGFEGQMDMMGNPNPNMRNSMNPSNNNGGALADYQMQLMLLEQQNKKRLMMARQEQDVSATRGEGGMGPQGLGAQGAQGYGAPAMSPRGSRTGQSPGPNDQMKRGTPKMSTSSPMPDGTIAMNRNSPSANNFDGSGMPPNMHPFGLNKLGGEGVMMGGPHGNQAMRGLTPQFTAGGQGVMTPQQQMELFRRQGGMTNGWAGQMPAQMMAQGQMPPQQGQPQPQPQQQQQQQQAPQVQAAHADNSQQRTTMPPPQAPTNNGNNGTGKSSPQQPAAPPTPSQTNKPNPKKKDTKESKKKASKKGPATAGATPASEPQDAPTPTPPTPATPSNPQSFNMGANKQPPGRQAPATNQAQGATGLPNQGGLAGSMGQDGGANNSNNGNNSNGMTIEAFSGMDMGADANNFNMDFASMGEDNVLEGFDFDAFLQMDPSDSIMPNFDTGSFNIGGDGVETGMSEG